jgi:hypothetical protein
MKRNSMALVRERTILTERPPLVGEVATRAKARTVFARSYAGVVGSSSTRGMNVCVRLFRLCCPVHR